MAPDKTWTLDIIVKVLKTDIAALFKEVLTLSVAATLAYMIKCDRSVL